MKKTIALIISVILVVAIFASCAPTTEDTAITDEETEIDAIDIEEDDALAALDSSSNAGLPINTSDPRCCKNSCGEKLSKAWTDKYIIRPNQDCFKCPKCQTQYVRYWEGDKWEYCDVQINSKDPKCCKCNGKLKFTKSDVYNQHDIFTCSKCGKKYNRYWTGDFWDYEK